MTFGTIVVENGGKIEGKVNFASLRNPPPPDYVPPKDLASRKGKHAPAPTPPAPAPAAVAVASDAADAADGGISPQDCNGPLASAVAPDTPHAEKTFPPKAYHVESPSLASPENPAEVNALVTPISHSPE